MSVALMALGGVPEGKYVHVCADTWFTEDVESLRRQADLLLSAAFAVSDPDRDLVLRRDILAVRKSLTDAIGQRDTCDAVQRSYHVTGSLQDVPAVRAARHGLEALAMAIHQKLELLGQEQTIPGATSVPWEERVVISQGQRRTHMVAEIVSLAVVVPAAGYIATRRSLPAWMRIGAGVVGLGTLAISGAHLSTYVQLGPRA